MALLTTSMTFCFSVGFFLLFLLLARWRDGQGWLPLGPSTARTAEAYFRVPTFTTRIVQCMGARLPCHYFINATNVEYIHMNKLTYH